MFEVYQAQETRAWLSYARGFWPQWEFRFAKKLIRLGPPPSEYQARRQYDQKSEAAVDRMMARALKDCRRPWWRRLYIKWDIKWATPKWPAYLWPTYLLGIDDKNAVDSEKPKA